MSRFFSTKHASLTPYVPGEQPRDRRYVKLNTNESPFPPSPKVLLYVDEAGVKLNLYSDPECLLLRTALAEMYGLKSENVMVNNGSDESLNFAVMAFCDSEHPACFPDITYGFYPVFAQLNGVPYREIPLTEDLRIDIRDYADLKGLIFLANPNAPTGIALPLEDIETILRQNPESVVVVDEAYVDFGADSAVGLIESYDNLLVVQTFSKSRSMAGARLGYAMGCPELIRDLQTIRYSTNPYNVNSMTLAAGLGALEDQTYYDANARIIGRNREYAANKLKELGFEMTDSMANFLFVRHPKIEGQTLYEELKARGVLVRHFNKERIKDYNRITIGTAGQMDKLLEAIQEILETRQI
ncbi:MAG: histidinol-phosphate transaminase [Lachnospiraceae bacterium]|nr:histidinol-phosphate transaminase [Lachnospiraceae bacterium]